MTAVPADEHWLPSATRAGEPLPTVIAMRWRWFKDAGARARRRYRVTEMVGIVAAAAIPVAAAARLDGVLVAAIGAIVLVATSIRTTFQLHEAWIGYSLVRYAIEREVALWMCESPPYEGDRAVQGLITRVEDLAKNSSERWAARRAQVDHTRTTPS